ncbi:ankyrin repeat domain-containing protein [Parashewanella spongiae]|uniref:Ankyrin repeat domain-containing protein n=1 Tax=Parashewanella spongiae TaxID=342950 RepID=A0A3A6UNE1_9GAMM|nr:ankyrin repeat domain-containing protein [Parashewanella spongiae]MCL1077169.1 ankyrin repeat domain-containing protein [Parashewanella spongiae]RJY19325.1 ankyrin repeat domain-containing protein [Parashewanella spongiae]
MSISEPAVSPATIVAETTSYASMLAASVGNTESVFAELDQIKGKHVSSSILRKDLEFLQQSINQCGIPTRINWQGWVNWLIELSNINPVSYAKTCEQLHEIKETLSQPDTFDNVKQSALSQIHFQLQEINSLDASNILTDLALASKDILSVYQSVRLRLLVSLITDHVYESAQSQCSSEELQQVLLHIGLNSDLADQFTDFKPPKQLLECATDGTQNTIEALVLKFAPKLGIILTPPNVAELEKVDYETLKELERQIEVMCSDAQVLRYCSRLVQTHFDSVKESEQKYPQQNEAELIKGIERLETLIWGNNRTYKEISIHNTNVDSQAIFDASLQNMADNHDCYMRGKEDFPKVILKASRGAYELRHSGCSYFSLKSVSPNKPDIPLTLTHVSQIYNKLLPLTASLNLPLIQQAISNTTQAEELVDFVECLNLGRPHLNGVERHYLSLVIKRANAMNDFGAQIQAISPKKATVKDRFMALVRNDAAFGRQSSYHSQKSSPMNAPKNVNASLVSQTASTTDIPRGESSSSLVSMASNSSSSPVEVYNARPFKSAVLFEAIDKDDLAKIKSICQTQSAKPLVAYCGHGRSFNLLLHRACEKNSVKTVAFLLKESQLNPNVKNENGETALHIACRENKHAIVKLLVNCGKVKVNSVNRDGATPFHLACIFGHLETSKHLLKSGKVNQDVKIPLSDALRIKGESVNLQLVWPKAAQPLVDSVSFNNVSAWHCCCFFGHQELAKVLLKFDANLILQSSSLGDTALHFACTSGEANMVDWIVGALPKNTKSTHLIKNGSMGLRPFQLAVITGNEAIVEVLSKKIDAHHCHNFEYLGSQWSVLQVAIQLPCNDMLNRLLKDDLVDVNSKVNGKVILEYALELPAPSHASAVITSMCLYGKGLDLSAKNDEGSNILHLAARMKNVACMEVLLNELDKEQNESQIACLTELDTNGSSPLHYAVLNDDKLMVKLLCSRSFININGADQKGFSPLMLAVERELKERIEQLLDMKSINILHTDRSGKNALHLATIVGNADIVELILAQFTEIEPQVSSIKNSATLEDCIEATSVVPFTKKRLLAVSDNLGMTALHYACEHGQLAVLHSLLKESSHLETDCEDSNGNKPLHIACKHNNMEIIHLLIEQEPTQQIEVEGEYPSTPAISAHQQEKMVTHQPLSFKKKPMFVASVFQKKTNAQSIQENDQQISEGYRGNDCGIKELEISETYQTTDGKIAYHNFSAELDNYINIDATECFKPTGSDRFKEVEKTVHSLGQGAVSANVTDDLDANGADDYLLIESENGNSALQNENSAPKAEPDALLQPAKVTKNITSAIRVINSRNGETPLHSACRKGNLQAVKTLLAKMPLIASVQNEYGVTAFNMACKLQQTEAARVIAKAMKRKFNAGCVVGDKDIHRIARKGDVAAFGRLNFHDVDINACNDARDTALHIALEYKHYEIAEKLLALRGINVNHKSAFGEDELDFILRLPPSQSQLLVAALECINPALSFDEGRGLGILMNAIKSGNTAIVRVIFDHICSKSLMDPPALPQQILNLSDHPQNQNTLVHIAVIGGHAELLTLLCKFGFSASSVNADGDSALHQLLKEEDASYQCFQAVIKFDDVDAFKVNLKKQTALHVALDNDKEKWIPEILALKHFVTEEIEIATERKKANLDDDEEYIAFDVEFHGINQRDKRGETALTKAIRNRKHSVVESLLSAGASLDVAASVVQKAGERIPAALPMEIALEINEPNITELLETAKTAKSYQVGADGSTSLHRACLDGNSDALSFILLSNQNQQDSFINQVNGKGDTALHLAVSSKIPRNVESLLQVKGIDFQQKNSIGETVLHLAFRIGNIEIIRMLLGHYTGDLITLTDNEGNNLLHAAAQFGEFDTFNTLLCLSTEAAINYSNSKGDFPIHIACRAGHSAIAKQLAIRDRNQFNVMNKSNYSPIMLAVLWQRNSTVIALQEAAGKAFLNGEFVFGSGDNELEALDGTLKNKLTSCLKYYGTMDVFVVALLFADDEIIRSLSGHAYRCRLNIGDKKYQGYSLLHVACNHSNHECMEIMMGAKYQQNIEQSLTSTIISRRGKDGETLVKDMPKFVTQRSTVDDYEDILKCFDINETAPDDCTLLHLVVDTKDEAKLRIILDKSDISLINSEMTFRYRDRTRAAEKMTAAQYAVKTNLISFADQIYQRRATLLAEAEEREKLATELENKEGLGRSSQLNSSTGLRTSAPNRQLSNSSKDSSVTSNMSYLGGESSSSSE